MSNKGLNVACPVCGCGHIEVIAEVSITINKDESYKTGDYTWDDDTTATCPECGHEATIAEFKVA